MQLAPRTTTRDGSVTYDPEGRVLYADLGAPAIAETLSAPGVNFDIRGDGVVVGIEVLLNAPEYLTVAQLPRRSENGLQCDLILREDPCVSDEQVFDETQQLLQVGSRPASPRSVRLSQHVDLLTDGTTLALLVAGVSL